MSLSQTGPAAGSEHLDQIGSAAFTGSAAGPNGLWFSMKLSETRRFCWWNMTAEPGGPFDLFWWFWTQSSDLSREPQRPNQNQSEGSDRHPSSGTRTSWWNWPISRTKPNRTKTQNGSSGSDPFSSDRRSSEGTKESAFSPIIWVRTRSEANHSTDWVEVIIKVVSMKTSWLPVSMETSWLPVMFSLQHLQSSTCSVVWPGSVWVLVPNSSRTCGNIRDLL